MSHDEKACVNCGEDRSGEAKVTLVGVCKCGLAGLPAHPCPYQEDVNNDSDFQCECCAACERECCDDI
jgi:hypothetical protein